MAEKPKHDVAIEEIIALEDRRYRAMIAGDAAVLDDLGLGDTLRYHLEAPPVPFRSQPTDRDFFFRLPGWPRDSSHAPA